ncbi:MAG TPA: MoaD/ThiS family protein [Candidatus Baltobacteraceae bacterium]|nr:MoaD/ThiS family protein [Candidatus Baltobacteraceae bacterium]
MRVRVVPFARLRELVGEGALLRDLPDGTTAGDAWDALAIEFPALVELERSTRLARNGSFVTRLSPLADGDELALLPPYGGG